MNNFLFEKEADNSQPSIRTPNLYTNSQDLHFETFQNYEMLVENRDKLKNFLSDKSIGTLIQWNGLATNDIGDYYKKSKSSFSTTKQYFNDCIMLPINTAISDDEIEYVIKQVNLFYE